MAEPTAMNRAANAVATMRRMRAQQDVLSQGDLFVLTDQERDRTKEFEWGPVNFKGADFDKTMALLDLEYQFLRNDLTERKAKEEA